MGLKKGEDGQLDYRTISKNQTENRGMDTLDRKLHLYFLEYQAKEISYLIPALHAAQYFYVN